MKFKENCSKKKIYEINLKENRRNENVEKIQKKINEIKKEIDKLKIEKSDRFDLELLRNNIDKESIMQVHHDMQMYVDSVTIFI